MFTTLDRNRGLLIVPPIPKISIVSMPATAVVGGVMITASLRGNICALVRGPGTDLAPVVKSLNLLWNCNPTGELSCTVGPYVPNK